MFSSAFVCLLAGLCKSSATDFHKILWKGGTRGPWQKLFDLDGNPYHVMLWLLLGWCNGTRCALEGMHNALYKSTTTMLLLLLLPG